MLVIDSDRSVEEVTHFYGKDVGAVLQKSRQTCYGRCYKERTPEGVDVCIIKVRTA